MSRSTNPSRFPCSTSRHSTQTIRDEIEPVVLELLESQMFVMGPRSLRSSPRSRNCAASKRGIGCASGTDALLLPLMAANIGAGDEVITTPYSFFATAGSIWRTGAKPVFVDIEPDTYNIDPTQIEAAITSRTRAIIPVHLYGQMADMGPINQIASKHGLFVLEDAAQAIGARYHEHPSGSLGHVGAFSFYPSKNLGGFGDAGMMVTNETELGRLLARLRVHGMEPKYHHHEVGFNSRLDALQAAVLRVKLRHLEAWTNDRREAAARYQQLFDDLGLTGNDQPAPRARGLLSRLQPVHHPRSRLLPRPAPRTSHRPPDRHRNLLPDPAPPAALFQRLGSQER